MAIQTVYYRQKIAGTGWRYRPITVGRRPEAAKNGPYFIRVRNSAGKYQWVKHDTEQAAAKAAKTAPVARQAQELGLTVDDLTNEANTNRVSIKTAVKNYLQDRRFGRPRSIAAYENAFDQLLENLPRGVRFVDQLAKSRALNSYVEFLSRKGYSNKTVTNRMGFVFSLLKANGVDKPSKLIKLPKVQRTRTKAYNSDELSKLFAVVTPEEYLRYLFFVRTGCREQEVQYATWKDLDLRELRFTVSGEGKSDVAFLPKNHEERQVPLTTELGALLAEHKKLAVSDRWVFTNEDGKPEGHFLRKFKAIAKRAGLNCGQCKVAIREGRYDNRHEVEVTCETRPVCEEHYLHRLRKTAATNWLRSGFDLMKIKSWLGHKSLEVTHRTIERVARESFGRLVAYLSVHTHDLASAEDALSNALVSALNNWPQYGVPKNPEAWLLTAARHSLIDVIRHQKVVLESQQTLKLLTDDSTETTLSTQFPDERLKLLFVCAHPAIDAAMHTPLMLQTVLGLDAARIAQAFLITPKAMGQRLFRAKTKIHSGGIPFEIPQGRDLPERLDAVLEAIYAAFGIGWDDTAGADQRGRDLAGEALWLARVLSQLMLGEAEVQGLLALTLHCEARRSARRGRDGRYVPLSEQNPKQWSLPLIEEAERHLAEAFKLGHVGRFQLEAAIQSVHAGRARSGRTDWTAIVLFYEQLLIVSPALGTRAGYAAAVAEATGPEPALAVLDAMDPGEVSGYQPYWAVRAHILQRLGKTREAAEAYGHAIGLAEDPAVREFLLQKRG